MVSRTHGLQVDHQQAIGRNPLARIPVFDDKTTVEGRRMLKRRAKKPELTIIEERVVV